MAREVNLTSDDLQSLEQELTGKRAELYEEQAHFLETLVKRAKAGASRSVAAKDTPGWLWTWTYRF